MVTSFGDTYFAHRWPSSSVGLLPGQRLITISYIYVCVYMYMCIHVYVYTESTLRMSRNHFSPNILRKTHKARLLGRGIGVFREFENWKQLFYCVTYRVILHRDISRSTASCMYMRFPVPRLDPPTRSFVTRGGGTKAPSANLSVSIIFDLAKVPVIFFKSHSYWTAVTEVDPRRHLSSINVIFNSQCALPPSWKIRKITERGQLASIPSSGLHLHGGWVVVGRGGDRYVQWVSHSSPVLVKQIALGICKYHPPLQIYSRTTVQIAQQLNGYYRMLWYYNMWAFIKRNIIGSVCKIHLYECINSQSNWFEDIGQTLGDLLWMRWYIQKSNWIEVDL